MTTARTQAEGLAWLSDQAERERPIIEARGPRPPRDADTLRTVSTAELLAHLSPGDCSPGCPACAMDDPAKYVVVFESNHTLVRWQCVICGGETTKNDVQAVAYHLTGGERHQVGMVCDPCAFASGRVADILREKAAELREEADRAERGAAATWDLPTDADWRRVSHEVAAAYRDGGYPDEDLGARTQWYSGHDPLPSFIFGREDALWGQELHAMLGPSGHRGPDDPPYDTCYPDCPPCAEMAR
jgi:hypothetical protein